MYKVVGFFCGKLPTQACFYLGSNLTYINLDTYLILYAYKKGSLSKTERI